jgi:hypothetical protein
LERFVASGSFAAFRLGPSWHMTGPEMNARLMKKTKADTIGPAEPRCGASRAVLILMATGLTMVLAGCAGAFRAETDAQSPVAPRVQQLVDANRGYPRWQDFPAAPTDLPAPADLAQRATALDATGTQAAQAAARIEWTLGDAGQFERDVASRIEAQQIAPVTALTGAAIDAYAQSLRDRAKAPPPIDRRD